MKKQPKKVNKTKKANKGKKSNHFKPDPYMIDDENPEWTVEDFRKARPAIEILPKLIGKKAAAELLAGKIQVKPVGRPRKQNPKVSTTIRLDASIIEEFRSFGPGWQTCINSVLHQWLSERPH